MIRRRKAPDGLPFRVYAEFGPRVWRIYYKPLTGPRVDLYKAFAQEHTKEQATRIAWIKYAEMTGQPIDDGMTFEKLWRLYDDWQVSLSENDTRKLSAESLVTNRYRVKSLLAVFGPVSPDDIAPPHWTKYQDARAKQGIGPGINQEIALASSILSFGVARGYCERNSTTGVRKVRVFRKKNLLTLERIDEIFPIAERLGPQYAIQVLAVRCAMLCAKRPLEARRLRRDDISDRGIRFTASKQRRGAPEKGVVVQWSDELRSTIAKALAVKGRVDVTPLVFPTRAGKEYTRSGWGSGWLRLMKACDEQIPGFVRFTLRDGRAGGVTRKKARGDTDTSTLTQHADETMINQVYDLNVDKSATPAA